MCVCNLISLEDLSDKYNIHYARYICFSFYRCIRKLLRKIRSIDLFENIFHHNYILIGNNTQSFSYLLKCYV